LSIHFYNRGIKFRLKESRKVKELIIEVIRSRNKEPGDLNYIFTGTRYIKELNRKYLNHDYPTDVISFSYGENIFVSGDVYLGLNAVKNNSKIYKVKYENEILRVIIHGTLHLMGYNDYSEGQRRYMRGLENKWLKIAEKKYGIQI